MTELLHEIVVPAPARKLFDLIADVVEAPQYFPTHLYAEIASIESAHRDLVGRWVVDNGTVRGWRLWRTRDTEALAISFEHEAPKPPLTRMRGNWTFEALADGGTHVRVRHTFELATTTPAEAAEQVCAKLDDNVPAQLDNLAALACHIDVLRANTFTSERAVRVDAPAASLAENAASSLGDPAQWALLELADGLLVFKQHAGLEPHLHTSTGEYRRTEEADGTTVRLRRTVTLSGRPSPQEAARAREQLEADVRDQIARFARSGPYAPVR
ncbi:MULTISPECIES: SRPBCC family protein [unclassified Streptomyces]|uniref:SRPBCC family protein n=1 Tax=unclassified Streptomyces TaxID=2593676 RepID=UPI002E27F8ED|nr:SRPBCC family protein [Streptomyces sp. NBC_00273]